MVKGQLVTHLGQCSCSLCVLSQGAAKQALVSDAQSVIGRVYSLGPKDRQLGFPDHGTSTYYSPDVTRQEIDEGI